VSDAPQEFKLLTLYIALEGEYREFMQPRFVQYLARRRICRLRHEECISKLAYVSSFQTRDFLLRIRPRLTAVRCVRYDKGLKEFQAGAGFEMRVCERAAAVPTKR
jgi:hypothetical protein